MKRKIFYVLLLVAICPCHSQEPYEATWMELTKVNGNYVVYSYLDPDLDDEKYRTPRKLRLRGNQLTFIQYNEPAFTYLIDKVKKKGNDGYLFRSTEGKGYGDSSFIKFRSQSPIDSMNYSFRWFDREKHIAKWTTYYSDGRISSDYLYIDSLYNKYPIVDYKWKDGPIDGEAD